LEGRDPEIGASKIEQLMNACDDWLDVPPRNCIPLFVIVVNYS
jgi:elongation factor Tu